MRLATSAWRRALAIGTVAVMLAACAAPVPREPPDRAFTEFNLFRYGKRDGGGVIAQQYALRVYGDATAFLRALKAERVRLVELMAKEGLRAAP